MCTQEMRALSYVGAEKITFPPNMTDRHTDGRDISVYRVASLLKIPISSPFVEAITLQTCGALLTFN